MEAGPGMHNRKKYLLPGGVLLFELLVSYALLVGKPRPKPVEPEPSVPPVVQVIAAQPADLALSVSTQGTVRPRREINIVSQVGGLVERVDEHFAEGGFFDAGTELVKVEDADYQFALVRAEARVADAAQVVAQEKGRGKQAAREWRDLGNDESNQLFLRKPQLAGAEAALRAAEADLGEARLNLRRTSITAPFNGRISEKHVGLGQYITPGTPVARVYDTDVVEIRLPLTDRQVALLDLPLNYQDHTVSNPGAPVSLHARFADREWTWAGRIVRTDASIDVDSRVVYAVAEVEKPFQLDAETGRPPLAIGLFVTAEIQGRGLREVVTLPRSALRNDGSILLVDGDDRLQPRQVRVLKSNAREAWVQGVARNERVVVSQPALAVAGMSVTVKNVETLAGGM